MYGWSSGVPRGKTGYYINHVYDESNPKKFRVIAYEVRTRNENGSYVPGVPSGELIKSFPVKGNGNKAYNKAKELIEKLRGEALKAEAKGRKRVKTVFPTGEIPHLWAHKVQASASNPQRNLYFEQAVIYSYGSHFPIAAHVTNKQGKSAVLFNTAKYSNTTSGHQSAVRSAIPPSVPVFEVPNVRDSWRTSKPSDDHKSNVIFYVAQIKEAYEKSLRARDHKQYRMQEVSDLRKELAQYCKFFALKVPALPFLKQSPSQYLKAMRTEQAKQAAITKQRNAARAAEYAEQERIRQEREAQEKAKAESDAIAWRNGANVRNRFWESVMLRVEGQEVVTSLGARVPVAHAKRAVFFIQQVINSGVEYRRNGHSFHLGYYTLDRVETNGNIHAGCHHINWEEIQNLIPQLESIPDAAEASNEQ